MGKDLFDFEIEESPKKEEKKAFKDELHKAEVLCIRGQYDKSLKIYESILDEDIDNQDAYLGILRVHSEDFTLFEGKDIENDIKVIEKLFEDIDNPDYLAYMKKRNVYLKEKKPAPKPVSSESKAVREEPIMNFAPAPKKVIDPKYLPFRADLNNKLLALLNLSQHEADELIADTFIAIEKTFPSNLRAVLNTCSSLANNKALKEDDVENNHLYLITKKSITEITFWHYVLNYSRKFDQCDNFARGKACVNICSDTLESYGWYNKFSKNRNVDQNKVKKNIKEYIDLGMKYLDRSENSDEYYDGPGVPSAIEHMQEQLEKYKEMVS